MKKTIITIQLAFALLVVPAFGGNDKNYTYLALGDSVAFGMNPLLFPPFSPLVPKPTPDDFTGYPEIVAAAENLLKSKKEVNAACPGETSTSFLYQVTQSTLPDFGCNSWHPFPLYPPFKATIGLHTNYTGTQMDFAESQLSTNKHINLVTLSIGASDLFFVLPGLQACSTDPNPMCTQKVLAPVLQAYDANLRQILTRIRAHYQGTLVLMKYYSPSPAFDGATLALNAVMTQVASSFPAISIADGFTAFQLASKVFDGDACNAGLLIRLSKTQCDVESSPLGQALLAAAVESAASLKH